MKKDTRIGIAAAIFLGAVFLFSGIGKLVVPPAPGYQLADIGQLIFVLPYIEIGLGFLLILGVGIKILSLASLGLILCFATNNLWLVFTYGFITCGACLGWGIDTWAGASLFIDILMLFFVVLAYAYSAGGLRNIKPSYMESNGTRRWKKALRRSDLALRDLEL